MQRDIGADFFQDPVTHLLEFAVIIVRLWNDQIRDFEPDVCFLFQPLEGIEDRL